MSAGEKHPAGNARRPPPFDDEREEREARVQDIMTRARHHLQQAGRQLESAGRKSRVDYDRDGVLPKR